jgi:hypothetical protein
VATELVLIQLSCLPVSVVTDDPPRYKSLAFSTFATEGVLPIFPCYPFEQQHKVLCVQGVLAVWHPIQPQVSDSN